MTNPTRGIKNKGASNRAHGSRFGSCPMVGIFGTRFAGITASAAIRSIVPRIILHNKIVTNCLTPKKIPNQINFLSIWVNALFGENIDEE
jgi:hypothetical protein